MVLSTGRWIDLESGQVDRAIFADEELYRRELEQVFLRSWLFVGHESQLPAPGDFVTTTMGEDRVIVTRTQEGGLAVLLNSCRHRGNAVMRANLGHADSFMCSYHGWTFGTDGALLSIPGFKELYHEDLDRAQWGLVRCPQVESFHGLIFANWDPTAPDLRTYMGEFAWFLETRVDPQGHGSELNGGVFKWTMDHNWKFAADNFVGDGYHGYISHQSALLAGHRTANSQSQGQISSVREMARFTQQASPDTFRLTTKYGSGAGLALRAPDAPVAPANVSEELAQYYVERNAAMERRLGPNRARLGGWNCLFPNFSINSSADQIHVWHPRGPLVTESWVYVLVDRTASDTVKKELVRGAARHFGPTGMFEQDDSDNWRLSTTGAKSQIGRRHPLNYSMGLRNNDWLEPKEDLPHRRMGNMGDTNQLNFYRHWQELMLGTSWDELQRMDYKPV